MRSALILSTLTVRTSLWPRSPSVLYEGVVVDPIPPAVMDPLDIDLAVDMITDVGCCT